MHLLAAFRPVWIGAIAFGVLVGLSELALLVLPSIANGSPFQIWPWALAVILPALISGGVCGFLARQHDFRAVALLGVIESGALVALITVSEFRGGRGRRPWRWGLGCGHGCVDPNIGHRRRSDWWKDA